MALQNPVTEDEEVEVLVLRKGPVELLELLRSRVPLRVALRASTRVL